MQGRKAPRHQTVVLQNDIGAFEHLSVGPGDIAHHQFVHLHLVCRVDLVPMGLIFLVTPKNPTGLRPLPAVEQRIRSAVRQDEFQECHPCRVTTRKLMACQVFDFHLERPFPLGRSQLIDGQAGRFVLQRSDRAGDGGIELGGRGAQTELDSVVAHQLQHEGIAADQVVFAKALGEQPIGLCGRDGSILNERHVAGLALHVFGIERRVDPLEVGGLLKKDVAGFFAVKVLCVGIQ